MFRRKKIEQFATLKIYAMMLNYKFVKTDLKHSIVNNDNWSVLA